MLIENSNIANGDIVSLKLSAGEEVIAKLESETATSFMLSKPMMLSISAKGIALAPIMMTSNVSTISLNKNNVIFGPVLTDKDIADQYTYQTTGIQPVSAGSIIT